MHPVVGENFRSLGTFGSKDGTIDVALESEQKVVAGTLKALEIQSLARYEYDLEGNMIASTDRLGNTTRYEYDMLNRRTKTLSPTTDPEKTVAVSEIVYDKAGNPWKQVDPYGNVTENVFGPFGEIVKTVRIANDHRGDVQTLTAQYEYDNAGRLVKATDPAGRNMENKYDALGRRIETINALGQSEKTEYDKNGQVIAEIDAAGNRTEYRYNLQGQRIATTMPKPGKNADSPTHRQAYNKAGQLMGSISPTGRVQSYLYDEFGRQSASYLGLLKEKPTRSENGKSVYAFENIFPNETYSVFVTWKKSLENKGETSVKVLENSDELFAGNIDVSENPKNDPWLIPFCTENFVRLGESFEPKSSSLTVEVDAAPENLSVYVLRTTPMSRLTYNDEGQVQSRMDAKGNSIFYSYDEFGRQISALRDGDENLCCSEGKTFYNEKDQTFASMSPDGRLNILGYDALGRQNKAFTGFLQEVKTGQYKLEGLPIGESFDVFVTGKATANAETLKLGEITLTKENTVTITNGTLEGKLAGQGHVAIVRKVPMQEIVFDFAGRTVATLDAKGNETRLFHDSLGRQIAAIQPAAEGQQTRLATHRYFDEAGNITAQVVVPVDAQSLKEAGKKRVTTMEYDVLGRATKIVQPSPDGKMVGPVTLQKYDERGNLVSAIDPLGHETQYAYDHLGRKIGEKNAEGGVTRFSYDNDGRMTSLTDPVGNTTAWDFGMNGRVAEEHVTIDGVTLSRTFLYDASDNIVQKIDRNGRVTEFAFDKLNRPISETWYDNAEALKAKKPVKTFRTTYNRAGKMATMEDGENNFEFSYNCFGQEIGQKQSLAGLDMPVAFEYSTDILGLRTEYTAKLDGKVDHANQYAFDHLGRAVTITQSLPLPLSVPGKNLLDKRAELAYDDFGQTASLARFEGDASVAETQNTFDMLGRVTNISHKNGEKTFANYDLAWDAGNRIVEMDMTDDKAEYMYDKTSQLLGAEYTSLPKEEYAYDLNGNRSNFETGEFNRLLSDAESEYQYDNEGNRVAKGDTKYFWDHRNRLTKVTTPAETVEYVYDYKNRLVKRNDETFVHDGWQVVMALQNGEVKDRYLWGAKQDELLCKNDEWMLGDHLNTVRDIVKSDGSVVKHLEYNAFGELQGEHEEELAFRYTGKMFDKATGLQWNINRWYDPAVGRWISEDPIGFEGKDTNLARYVGNRYSVSPRQERTEVSRKV